MVLPILELKEMNVVFFICCIECNMMNQGHSLRYKWVKGFCFSRCTFGSIKKALFGGFYRHLSCWRKMDRKWMALGGTGIYLILCSSFGMVNS